MARYHWFAHGLRPLRLVAVGTLFLALLWLPGCGHPTVESRPVTGAVTIDGDARDWEGSLYSLEDGKVVVGFKNDAENLYACLGSGDRTVQRQILAHGMTVWFDPSGGNKKVFGIRFPLVDRSLSPEHGPEDRGPDDRGDADESLSPDDRGRGSERRRHGPDPEAAIKALQDPGAELELVGENTPAARMFVEQAAGIDLRIGWMDGSLVYELKIPLAKDAHHPYAVGETVGKTVGFGVETPKFDRRAMEERFRDRRSRGSLDDFSFNSFNSFNQDEGDGRFPGGGGRGGPDGEFPGGRRGGMGRGGPGMGMPDQLSLWIKVRLAKSDGTNGSGGSGE